MDPQPDVIRQQIEETRSHLTEKLETLEAEVKGTVQSAKETVEETISSVKETMTNAKEAVKRTFDVRYQVDQHPWAMLGLSAISGLALGVLVGGRLTTSRRVARRMSEASVEPPMRHAESAPARAWSRLTQREPGQPGFLDKLADHLGDEVDKAKDLAIQTAVRVVDNVVRQSIPALGAVVEDMLGRAATNFTNPPQHGDGRGEQVASSGYQTPPMY
jgi:ElaB/YqjD/DUF883 family membrane-anchored ribosome-binding protein